MANSKNFISGKIGNVVYFERGGKQLIREHVVPKDPQTPAQLTQRMKLSLANKGLKPLKEIIKEGCKNDKNAYRSLVGLTMKENIIGEYPNLYIDYSKLKIVEGRLQLPSYVQIEIDTKSDLANIRWNTHNNSTLRYGTENDIVKIVCLNIKYLTAYHVSTHKIRSEGSASITLPKDWQPKDIHFWMYLTSQDMQHNSDSVYIVNSRMK